MRKLLALLIVSASAGFAQETPEVEVSKDDSVEVNVEVTTNDEVKE